MAAELFGSGVPLGVDAVLAERDERAALQRRLLRDRAGEVLMVAKLNIPGPVKNSEALHELFDVGIARLLDRVPDARIAALWNRAAGSALFALVRDDPIEMKRTAVDFEEADALGRLFDVDVLAGADARAASRADLGLPPRRCLVCARPAKECARSRRHGIPELRSAIQRIADAAAREAGPHALG